MSVPDSFLLVYSTYVLLLSRNIWIVVKKCREELHPRVIVIDDRKCVFVIHSDSSARVTRMLNLPVKPFYRPTFQ